MKVEAIIAVIGSISSLIGTKSVKKALFGSYSDGTPRSLADALDGEFISPTDRDRRKLKKHKKGKKKR